MASVLRPQIDLPMRPSPDKELHLFEPYDDLFDQYVEADLLQFSDNTLEQHSSDDMAGLFEDHPSNGSDTVVALPMQREAKTDEAWHQALRNLEQNPASPTLRDHHSSVYPESRGRASASDPEIFSGDELFGSHPHPSSRIATSTPTTPTTPTPSAPRGKTIVVAAIAQPTARSFRNRIRKAARKLSVSPKMMHPSQYRSGSCRGVWAERMNDAADAYNIQFHSDTIPETPPRTTKISQAPNSNSFLSNCDDFSLSSTVNNGFDDSKHDMNDQSHYQLTPLSSPTIDQHSGSRQASFNSTNNHISSSYFGHQLNNEALSALQTPPPSHRLPITTWGAETTENFDFNQSASPDFHASQKPQAWWPSGSTPRPSSTTYHHSRPETSGMGFGTVPASGLGISYDLSGFGEPNASAAGYPVLGAQLYSLSANAIPPAHAFKASMPPSRSPSSSPPPHRISGQRAASRHRQHSGQHHRRSSNSSNSGPRPASVGFVNFTPDDSRKILTGVAPSGSSKTKARRDKEAAEKRRKLSQAATRAIIEAGGDLTKLEREGLLCLAAEE